MAGAFLVLAIATAIMTLIYALVDEEKSESNKSN